jgi:hypothetical protein
MVLSVQEDVCRLHKNTRPFYTENLSILRFWYTLGPKDTKGMTIMFS